MALRVELRPEVMLVGGVTKNGCIAELLRKNLKADIIVPQEPKIVSAIRVALVAGEMAEAAAAIIEEERVG